MPIALEVFNRVMPQPNQIARQLPDYTVNAEELLRLPTGTITEAGLRQNVAVGLGYVEAWLRGIGCVPPFNVMEDAATAEISRAQLRQWVHHCATLSDERPVTAAMVNAAVDDELATKRNTLPEARAATLVRQLIEAERFPDFLMLAAYSEVFATEDTL